MPGFHSFDGTQIAYEIYGEGYPLVLVNGLANDNTYWKYAISHFAPHLQIISYDLRGHGRSDNPRRTDHVEIEHHARDLVELMDHLSLSGPVVAGFSLGVQIMFETYRHLENRMGALIAVTGPYENPLGTFYGLPIPKLVIDQVFGLAGRLEGPLAYAWPRILGAPFIYPVSRLIGATKASAKDMQGFYDHAKDMDVSLFLRFAHAAARHSAKDVLPRIEVPTLVIGGEKDTFTPAKLSAHMADAIPDADYLLVKGGTHTTLVEEPELVNSRIERFLRSRFPVALGQERV
jgi:pimeloyl-ACP methyl ester carboxylesterase